MESGARPDRHAHLTKAEQTVSALVSPQLRPHVPRKSRNKTVVSTWDSGRDSVGKKIWDFIFIFPLKIGELYSSSVKDSLEFKMMVKQVTASHPPDSQQEGLFLLRFHVGAQQHVSGLPPGAAPQRPGVRGWRRSPGWWLCVIAPPVWGEGPTGRCG